MDGNLGEQPEGHRRFLSNLLCLWFFAGMPLSMCLSGLYFFAALPLPPLLFFLPSLTYLSGGVLGGVWSRESLRRKGLSRAESIGTLIVLAVSTGFFLIGIVFAIIGFRRL